MNTALITAVGSAAAKAAMSGLRAKDWRVVGCDIYPKEWNVNAGEVDEFFQVPLAAEEEAFTQALLDAAKRLNINMILPLTDIEVDTLASRRERFAAVGVQLACLQADAAAACRDKLRMTERLRAKNLCDTIDTWLPSDIPVQPPFPMMLKPLRGRSSNGQAVVRTPQELASALRQRDDYIVQPFLLGHIITVDVARDRAGHVVALPREELLRTGNGLGTTVRTMPDHPLAAIAAAIAHEVGIVGVVNMEFIAHEGRYYFLEINPRFSGGVGFSALAGYDFVDAALRCYAGEEIASCPQLRPMTLAQRYEQYVTGE